MQKVAYNLSQLVKSFKRAYHTTRLFFSLNLWNPLSSPHKIALNLTILFLQPKLSLPSPSFSPIDVRAA